MYSFAFRHALRYRAESWPVDVGRAHVVCGHILEATSPKVKGHLEVNFPHKCPMATKFGRWEEPLTKV